MTTYFNKSYFIIILLLQVSLSHAGNFTRWSAESKNKYIEQCSSSTAEKSLPLYRKVFQGKMSTVEFNAFIQSINQQMANNCDCFITEASKRFSHQDFIDKPDSVVELAKSLSQPGASCSSNMNAMVEQMKRLMGILR